MPERHFTVEEANRTLDTLRPIVADMLEARQAIVDARPEVWPVLEKAVWNGGSRKAGDLLREFERVRDAVRQIEAMGILLKDVNTGLVDFPSLREGREVYLCWRYNEPHVSHWHELEAGFAGRQPL